HDDTRLGFDRKYPKFGVEVDDQINNGMAPYVFKIFGQVYHWTRALCLTKGDPPQFLQVHLYDTDNEVVINEYNELVKMFKLARDKCKDVDVPKLQIELYSVDGARLYELPTSQMLGGIVFESAPKKPDRLRCHHSDEGQCAS
ncbi:hypothetical protein Tco_1097937, partial [Tanacetum coccineum]